MSSDYPVNQEQLVAAVAAASPPPNDDSSPSEDDDASKKQPLLCIKQRSSKRKRSTTTNEDDTVLSTLSNRLQEFQHSPHSLRISASNVAALCGLHPYQNLPQLLFDLVYQSHLGQLLLQNDASLLGLQLVDAKTHERDQLLAMASSISSETKSLVQTSLSVSEGTTKLNSIDEVQSIQRQIQTNAIQSGKLSKVQVDSLVSVTRQNLSTGFGTSHEDDALDLYESVVGCCVRERNEALMTWRFERVVMMQTRSDDDDDDEVERDEEIRMGGVTARPMGMAKRREWGEMMMSVDKVHDCNCKNDDDGCVVVDAIKSEEKSKDEKEVEVIDLTDTTSSTTSTNTTPPSHQEHCFFKIVGAVDGIRDEIYIDSAPLPPTDTSNINNETLPSSDTKSKQCNNSQDDNIPNNNNSNNNAKKSRQDTQTSIEDEYNNFSDDDDINNEQWTIRPIIVECKHRMSQAKVPPPLYDQIQTCLYMKMYNVEEADLIQVVRRDKKRTTGAAAGAAGGSKNTMPEVAKDGVGVKGKENDIPIQKANNETSSDAKVTEDTTNSSSSKEKNNKEKKEENNIQITISRISLHDPIHNHQHHWNETLLPRLASFVDAVYNVRKDDGKRYRLLMALVQEQNYCDCNDDESNVEAWKVLWDEMPWLRDCDTAFGRRGMR